MNEQVLVIPKGRASMVQIKGYIKDIFKDIGKEIEDEPGVAERIQAICDELDKEDFVAGYTSVTKPMETYIVNQLDKVIIATNGNFNAIRKMSDRYKMSDLTYNEVVSRYQELAYGANNETILLAKRDSADLNDLSLILSIQTIREHVSNVLNDYDRYISIGMAKKPSVYFSGTLKEIDGKILSWLKGDEIEFDGEITGADGKALKSTHMEIKNELKEEEKKEETILEKVSKTIGKPVEEDKIEAKEELKQEKEVKADEEKPKPKRRARKPRTKKVPVENETANDKEDDKEA